jgi:hypothetical protein
VRTLPGLITSDPALCVVFALTCCVGNVAGSSTQTRDVLLWPRFREGYATRLFLSGPVQGGAAQNWNQYSICGRQWYVCSWQGVPATLPWIEILANHLRAFR